MDRFGAMDLSESHWAENQCLAKFLTAYQAPGHFWLKQSKTAVHQDRSPAFSYLLSHWDVQKRLQLAETAKANKIVEQAND